MFKICQFCNNLYTSEICEACHENASVELNLTTGATTHREDILKRLETTEEATVTMSCFNPAWTNDKLTYYTRETRSADESISLYVKCNVCGEKTKLDEEFWSIKKIIRIYSQITSDHRS